MGTIGKLGSGFIVDALFRRGYLDAHLRYYLVAIAIAIPALVAAFQVRNPILFILLLVPHYLLTMPSMGYASALIQLVTPVEHRAKISSLFLMIMNLVALGLGAVLIGWISEYAFAAPVGLGAAFTIVTLICSPLAAALIVQALKPARERLSRAA